ncbi:MAG TPA: ubiquitin-like protein Pup [Actinobacteria bacterium]|nr:ubiquitin-like protein Pup [Actinomycetota bacterium]
MPQRENVERKSTRPTQEAPEEQVAPNQAATERKAALDAEVDSMLDEIDDVLEVNAEDFVKSFVQKGGQ